MLDLAVTPGGVRASVRICAPGNDSRDGDAELGDDPIEDLRTIVLHGVMQERSDGLVLAATVFENQRSNGLQVSEVGNEGPAPVLAGVEELCLHQSLRVARAKDRAGVG